MGLDLSRDVTINGHEFKKGKNVETSVSEVNSDGKTVKTDYADSIKAIVKAADAAEVTEDKAVPTMEDPLTPTSGTPTRPVGNVAPGEEVDHNEQ